jgi:indolepyruvate ferredoxin oxidoreductase beta subunit
VNAQQRPVTILVAALGGQGGGVLAEWLVDAASHAGYRAQSTSIPGVAQRTGATTYYIEIFPTPATALAGREPVFSLLPVPGCIDVLVASELLEAARIVQNGMADATRTTIVTSSSRMLTTWEKMSLGDGRFASDRLYDVARMHSRRFVAFDMDTAARETATVVSAVMFGAVAATGVLPFGRDACEAAIDAMGVGAQASRRGFARGFDLTAAQTNAVVLHADPRPTPRIDTFAPSTDAFPSSCRDIVTAAYRRLAEFQDESYADLYLDRLAAIRDAERTHDPQRLHDAAITRETARFLALWMAFDDIVRVAQLKCRASRFARVRREVGAGGRDIVRIVDLFKPGVPEIAGLLPASLARPLLAWDRRRQSRGKRPFAIALHLRSDGVVGFAALRTLAALRTFRPRMSRYAEEQTEIERWLAAIATALASDWSCAYEVALCGRLIKGYGETNARGKRNLAHIVRHLAGDRAFASPAERAQAIRDAREAALADEGGRGLDAALTRHGAPARPVVAKPITWMKKPGASRPRSVA